MGRTISTYRVRLESEQNKRWKGLRNGLRTKDQENWDKIWDYAYKFSDAASNSLNPVVYDSILLSMLLGLQTELEDIKKDLKRLEGEFREVHENEGNL